ncbi:MAG TPA: alpha/beta hydrolase [Leptolyngbyaceae cyanobacterium]
MSRYPIRFGLFLATLAAVVLPAHISRSLPVPAVAEVNAPAAEPSRATGVETYAITLGKDPADVYMPAAPDVHQATTPLPIALMLPGALVDRSQYSQFASIVAQYGFAVVVPTHVRTLPEFGLTGELAETAQVPDALTYLSAENERSDSPLFGKLDLTQLALLGHSHGGFVGLQAIASTCVYPFCTAPFTRPEAVVAGVFYGVNTQNPTTGQFGPTANAGIPVALIQGSLDSIATPQEAEATYTLIETPPKALITIAGTNHYGLANENNPVGARPDSNQPTLDQAQGIEAIANWTGYFLRAHVLDDKTALSKIYGNTSGDGMATIQSQPSVDTPVAPAASPQ